jgi:hypothetical protein
VLNTGNPLVYALRIPHIRFALMRLLIACTCLSKANDRRPTPALLNNLSLMDDMSGTMRNGSSFYSGTAESPRSRNGTFFLMHMDAFRSRQSINNSGSTAPVDHLSVGWHEQKHLLRARIHSDKEQSPNPTKSAHRSMRRCSSESL